MTKSLRYRGAWRDKIVHAYCRKLENPEEKTGNVRMGGFMGAFGFVILLCIFFLPAIVSCMRLRHRTMAIFMLNLLLVGRARMGASLGLHGGAEAAGVYLGPARRSRQPLVLDSE